MSRVFIRFIKNSAGSVLSTVALTMPVVVMAAAAAMDYTRVSYAKQMLQVASDAAAVAAARELNVANVNAKQIEAVAKTTAFKHVAYDPSKLVVSTSTSKDPLAVQVNLRQVIDGMMLPQFKPTEIAVHSIAQAFGGTPLCILGLDGRASGVVSLDSNSRISAQTCAVYSNSTSSKGLSSKSNSVLSAELICSAGGKEGGGKNFKPSPQLDCPAIEDPLAGRAPPPVGNCDSRNAEIIDVRKTLNPGVYCGGLRIDGNAEVTLKPGIYVIKDGPLNIDSNAKVSGQYVGFFLTGDDATFRFASNAKVEFSAPKDGPMAGLLFFEAPDSPSLRRHEVLSNYAHTIVGTIYLPKGRLVIDADNDVADQSAYTAIIARRVELYSGPNLVLNTNYNLTDVPVPNGIGGNGKIVLVE